MMKHIATKRNASVGQIEGKAVGLHESEAEFASWVIGYAHLMGWKVWFTWKSYHSPKGEPDLRLIRERVVWMELKSMTGTLTPEQEEGIKALKDAGAEVYCFRPSDRPKIEEVLKR